MNFTNLEKQSIFKKYNIDPKNILAVGDNIDPSEKESLVCLLLMTHELAEKNFLKGNVTSSSYACALVLNDNSVYFGINFNNTRNEISATCAERMAILEAFNNKVKAFNPSAKEKFDYKIKYVLMSQYNGKGVFWTDKITPCADCLSWFNTGKNLSADTKICCLKKTYDSILYLDLQNLSDFLPLRNLVHKTIEKFSPDTKILKSEKAQKSPLDNKTILKLYGETYLAYKNNKMARTSGQNIAAGIISNGEFFFGSKVDFSKRWFIEPLEAACYKAIEKYKYDTKIEAICYVGEEYTITEANQTVKDGLVSLQTLGRISTRFTDETTIVITGSAAGIQINTIDDYMPGEHKFIHKYKIN